MKAVTLKCKSNSNFHFGKYAPDSNAALNNSDFIFHSDSLFSALVISYNNCFSDTDEFVKQFESGGIKISSLFYKIEILETNIWFLPKPVTFNLTEVDDYKLLKKITFISKKLYSALTHASELVNNNTIVVLQNSYALLASELNIKSDNLIQDIKLYNSKVQKKVYVNTEKQGDTLYQLNVIEIADNSKIDSEIQVHLYFLIESTPFFDEKFGNKFTIVLNIMSDSGIGAEKGTIGGLTGYSVDDNWQIDMEDGCKDFAMLASVCNPRPDEFDKLKASCCNSILRGGRLIDKKKNEKEQERLKSIRMLSEGSVVNMDLIGRIVDIKPDNWNGIPFKRNGMAFLLPVNKSWLE